MTPSRVAAVIPARLGSTRLPRKALADILGKPMVQWTYEAVRAARSVGEVIVATDSPEIAAAIEACGGRAAMTSPDHKSGTDRVAEVARDLDADVIVNVQGDEPLISHAALDALVTRFSASSCAMGTLVHAESDPAELANPARVKVVCRADGRALYFSRSIVPFDRDNRGTAKYWKHLGVYAYRRAFLLELAKMPVSPLEEIEQLEQLRVLENGHDILTVPVAYDGFGVDTPDDLEAMRRAIKQRISK
jgi:3-deoxy-manno-octulosonate cytidylyltransferase (CMP-KDO synthetase)